MAPKPRPAAKSKGRHEKAELARQGAKAAARGETQAANPLDAHEHSPTATGEPESEWRLRRDAWQAGYDQQSAAKHHARPPSSRGRDDEHD